MPASKALPLYQAYTRALERKHLAWERCEHLKQQHPLDVSTYWEAERAYERASREQVAAWATWGAERQTATTKLPSFIIPLYSAQLLPPADWCSAEYSAVSGDPAAAPTHRHRPL